MNYEGLKERIRGELILNAPMKKYTTWKIGGPADCLLLPKDAADIAEALRFAKEESIPCRVIGNGSNLLVLDGGIEGMVIRIGENMSSYTIDGTLLTAQSGCILARMARETAKQGFAGIEWAAGIPASMGGAAYMNAGAYGHCFYETLEAVEAVESNGEIRRISAEELSSGYRHTSLMESGAVVTKVMVRLRHGDKEALMASVEETLRSRREKQPLDLPSAGSVFKNPEGSHAGYLVELSGLRGKRIGNAQVSEKHGNFIVNLGDCTAKDVLALIEEVRAEVKKQQGYDLETEVLMIGRT